MSQGYENQGPWPQSITTRCQEINIKPTSKIQNTFQKSELRGH